MDERIVAAEKRLKAAKEALRAAVREAYPVGTVLEVTMGRARITGEVLSYGLEPKEVVIQNLQTRTTRRFSATYPPHDIRIVKKGKEAA